MTADGIIHGNATASEASTRETMKRLYLALKDEKKKREELEARASEPIAIIGMACRFPGGANHPAAFWELLESGRDGICTVPPDRWDAQTYLADQNGVDGAATMVTADGGFLNIPLTQFDYQFFHMSPKEARALDPQQRLLLEMSWEALESAGIVPATLKGSRTGVFVGISGDDYSLAHRHSGNLEAIDAYSITGSTASTAAGRIAYLLGLEGPAIPVDTACSSSLVALHMACQSLHSGETDWMLVGGVNLILAPSVHVCFSRLQAISPDGRSKSFDASANGYSRSEGSGMVVLKRLSDARRDGDRILAVIEATVVNQDGASNGFTAPNGAAQRRLLQEALDKAGLTPTDVQYVETHGTGTALGDPIEAEALIRVLAKGRKASAPLVLGAVKSNIGHMEAAAGMAGIIKVLLAMRHRRIPGNLHFRTPNPLIPWDEAPIAVPTTALPWEVDSTATGRRRAGISAFGFSGTNAHVILADPPAELPMAEHAVMAQGPFLLALSAHTPKALKHLIAGTLKYLRQMPDQDVAAIRDLCATALRHRTTFAHRCAVVGFNASELADQLEAPTGRNAASSALHVMADNWVGGQSLNADDLFPSGSYRLSDLPPYPFDPQPCSLGDEGGPIIPRRESARAEHPNDPTIHPLLTRRWSSPLVGETLWETDVELKRLPLLADHRIFGHPVMPAAGILSMLAAASRDFLGTSSFALTDITLPRALPLPETGRTILHLVLRPDEDGHKARLELASIGQNGTVIHATAKLEGWTPAGSEPAAYRPSSSAKVVDPEAIYEQQGEHLMLGAGFRLGQAFWRDGDILAAQLKAAPRGWETSFHPATLDAGLQLLPQLMATSDGSALVPVVIDRLEMTASKPASWVSATLSDGSGALHLSAEDGSLVMRLSGIRGLEMGKAALANMVAGAAASALAFEVTWQAVASVPAAIPTGRWIVVPPVDDNGWAEAVDTLMPTALLLPPGASIPAKAEGVLWLRGIDSEKDAGAGRLAELASLVQSLGAIETAPRLWVVTRAAQAITDREPVDPANAGLWGFGRALAAEMPRIAGGLLDVAHDAGPEALTAILAEIAATQSGMAQSGTQRALRDKMLAPRLCPITLPGAPETPAIKPNATYLITGGTGALGLQLAEWLVASGAESLVLTARRKPNEEVQTRLDALPARISLRQVHADDAQAMRELLGEISSNLPPLAGVFHLAGTAAAGLISNLTPHAIAEGIRGKVEGAHVLDRLTRDLKLDHFVLFSSVAGLLGATGQSIYSAGNAALDGIASARRADGLRGIAIAWGPWDGDGMAASSAASAQLAATGLTPLVPGEALAMLPRLLGNTASNIAVVRADWDMGSAGELTQDLRKAKAGAPAGRTGVVAALPKRQQAAALLSVLQSEAALALGIGNADDIQTDRDLFQLGLDSLMALRIRNAAEKAINRSLPATIVFDHPSLGVLCAAILAIMDSESPVAPIESRMEIDPHALSAGQQGLWFLQQLAPQSPAYNTCFSARIRSSLDIDALEKAFRTAVSRNMPLGSLIDLSDGSPRRRNASADLLQIERHDAAGGELSALRSQMEEAYRQPFRLESELPIRVAVWSRAPDDHLLLVTAHHISIDVWSFELLLEELQKDFITLLAGGVPDVTAPQYAYADYVAWQKNLLSGPKGEELRRFWAETLDGAQTSALPPLARQGAGIERLRGRSTHMEVDADRATAFEQLGQRHGATLYTTLLAAWMALEARLSGRGELVVGTPTLGRTDSVWGRTIGFFTTVVPVRVDLGDDPTWPVLLDRLRRAVTQASAHQDLPFRDIAALTPTTSRNDLYPLFQTLFHLRNVEDQGETDGFFVPGKPGSMPFGGISLEPFYIEQQEGQYPLTVEWFKTRNGLHCIFKYNIACYEEADIVSLGETYLAALDALVCAPDATVSEIDLLTAADRSALADWQAPDMALPPARCIHHRVQDHACATPNAIAITAQDGSLTYAQLDRRANALAVRLSGLGVVRGSLVGVCMDRSAALVVTLLAIAKAGAAYVPLSPELPDEALQFQTDDAGLALVAVQTNYAARFSAAAMPALSLDADLLMHESETAPSVTSSPEDLLYVLYTSGTTGRPKGVMVPHLALSSYIDAMQSRHPLPAGSSVLSKTPLTFDPSVGEIFMPLALGLRLIVAGPQDHRDPAAQIAIIKNEAVNLLYTVPSQLAVLLEEPNTKAAFKAMQMVICGGERMPATLIRRMHDLAPHVALLNVYGPTEATINVTSWVCPGDVSVTDEDVRIGTALANARALVLDSALRPAPIGAPGTLYLGGDCLARGYLNRPDLTDKAFVADPDDPSRRLYHTGDRVRLLRDGDGKLALQFLGREDAQIKLSGIRLELGEVEAVALRHPAVAQAAARIIALPSGERTLAVAILSGKASLQPTAQALRDFAAGYLSPAVVPHIWLPLPELPLTKHGKLDGPALDILLAEAVAPATTRPSVAAGTVAIVTDVWRSVLGIASPGTNQHFFELGGSSLMLAKMRRMLEERGFTGLDIIDLFRHPTIASLAAFLDKGNAETLLTPASSAPMSGNHAIAVIGMALRVPGANGLEEFWQLMETGGSGITRFSRDELLAQGVLPSVLADPAYVPANGALDGIDMFDARFFGYSPREAETLDPQQRLFLETAWHAMEHGGYGRRGLPQRVGVYAGSEISNYLMFNLASRIDPSEINGGYALALANDKDFLATRASYTMNLRGPAMTVQTACSTSLTAVVQACEALMSGHCDMALAGGVSLQLPQRQGYLYREGMVASPDGMCRPFDAAAAGTVNGNGVGVVLLKPLERALADGDTIHAVVKGWGINNDGANKLGFTAPSEDAQAAAVAQAWSHAGIEPARLGYIEAHGTGTPLGDPIEVAALNRAWGSRDRPPADEPCRLGAVKANIGHLGAAAGVVGLIKSALAVSHRKIPPIPGWSTPNPKIAFDRTPFAVAASAQSWPRRAGPALAGVSSFGIGGTNVHVVVEEAPVAAHRADKADRMHVLPISAGSKEGLATTLAELSKHLSNSESADLRDIAFTLQCGRDAHPWRSVIAAGNAEDAITRLATAADHARRHDMPPKVAALFPGQGAQHPDMMLDLYRRIPSFRADVDKALAHLEKLGGTSIETWRAMLFPSLSGPASPEAIGEATVFLGRTCNTQPALFVIGHALARLWQRLGIEPVAMLGHSVGEYVAATLAGVFSADDALTLVTMRGKLMQDLPPGDMLAVAMPASEMEALLGSGIDLAGDNGPTQCVISGAAAVIAEAKRKLSESGVVFRELETSHAFHSAMMDPILPAFRSAVVGIERRAPSRPLVSCLTGTWMTAEQAIDPDYWVAQLRGTVRFRAGVATLLEATPAVLLEIGPGRSLNGQLQQLVAQEETRVMSSARRVTDRQTSDIEALEAATAALWALGADITWDAVHEETDARRIPLPLYPFDRQRYWVDTVPRETAVSAPEMPIADLRPGPADRFYVPHWSAKPAPVGAMRTEGVTLVVPHGAVSRSLSASVAEVITATAEADYPALLADLIANGRFPSRIVLVEPSLELATRVARALEPHRRRIDLLLVTRNGQDVGSGEIDPAAALLIGPALVIPREMPWVQCRLIDMDDQGMSRLALELGCAEPLVAWRRNRRWTRSFEPLAISGEGPSLLARGGVVLITGGMGGIGLALARMLVRDFDSRIVLVGRGALEAMDTERRRVLDELGEHVRYIAADVCDIAAMQAVVSEAKARFGGLHAVIHCAGIAHQTPIVKTTSEGIATVLAPKVAGTLVLEQVLEDIPLDVMVLFSSSSAVLGSAGLIDYAAANAFLDAIAHRRTADGKPTISIGWDAWADIGMSRGGRAGGNRRLADLALTEAEGLDAFRRILACPGLPHVVVSNGKLPAMLADIARAAADEPQPILLETAAATSSAAVARHVRPEMAASYIAPSAGLERQIAAIWEDILGIAGIGAADNFFDLGGDSLIGGKLVMRLNEAMGTNFSPVVLYEAPTVQALALAARATADTGMGAARPSSDLDLDTDDRSRRDDRRRRRLRDDQESLL